MPTCCAGGIVTEEGQIGLPGEGFQSFSATIQKAIKKILQNRVTMALIKQCTMCISETFSRLNKTEKAEEEKMAIIVMVWV